MDQTNNNPLQKYFRLPGLSVRLPSQGRFQSEGNVTFTAIDDVPVLPMRSQDEMIMKNPDALMSGLALDQVIRSCVPSIKDPMQLPSPDVDAILLAIRAATYGNKMTIESECPHCSHDNAYEFDVTEILDTVMPLQDEYVVRLNDEVVVYIRPFNMRNTTQASTVVFHETRKMQFIEQDEIPDEERQKLKNDCFARLTNMNMRMVSDCIMKVVTPDGVVTNPEHIAGFMANIPVEWTEKLENELKRANEAGINKKHDVECAKCHEQWETVVEFDPTNFFGPSS